MTAQIINFRETVDQIREVAAASLAGFDTLACMYCGVDVPPTQVLPGPTVIYRCKCRKTFRITEDGSVWRGLRGRAF